MSKRTYIQLEIRSRFKKRNFPFKSFSFTVKAPSFSKAVCEGLSYVMLCDVMCYMTVSWYEHWDQLFRLKTSVQLEKKQIEIKFFKMFKSYRLWSHLSSTTFNFSAFCVIKTSGWALAAQTGSTCNYHFLFLPCNCLQVRIFPQSWNATGAAVNGKPLRNNLAEVSFFL